ncbi:MAG: rod shape-determining protein MreC [Candidatus Omnitrophica bacterium]|nr:rod shape-determining protein MreC [Candidatus Omnitrophota bacterium]
MWFKRPLFLAGAVLFPLLIGATAPRYVDQLRTFTISLSQPFLELQNHFSAFLDRQIQFLAEWPKLRMENEALRAELQRMKTELEASREIKRQVSRLEALLHLKGKISDRSVAARVIGRDPSHWSRFIVINKGSRDGVRKNTVLVHPDGLVGKVVAAGRHSARAILLPDAESRASAMNQRTRDVGLIQGMGSSRLKMTYLDRFSDVQVDDLIISSGLGGIYPKGIPIGTVETVVSEKNHLGLYALVKPFVTFSRLEEVLCVSSQTGG